MCNDYFVVHAWTVPIISGLWSSVAGSHISWGGGRTITGRLGLIRSCDSCELRPQRTGSKSKCPRVASPPERTGRAALADAPTPPDLDFAAVRDTRVTWPTGMAAAKRRNLSAHIKTPPRPGRPPAGAGAGRDGNRVARPRAEAIGLLDPLRLTRITPQAS